MARYNEILVGRYARAVQKLFGIKGEVPVASLAGELQIIHRVFNGRENRYLEDWKLFGQRINVGGVAAQDSVVRINNPAGSNTIAVLESAIVWTTVTNVEYVMEYSSVATGNLTGVGTPANFDNRTNPAGTGNNGAQCTMTGQNNIPQSSHVILADLVTSGVDTMTNDFVNYDEQEIPLLPNSSLQWRTLTLNTALVVSIRWRERFLEEQERT